MQRCVNQRRFPAKAILSLQLSLKKLSIKAYAKLSNLLYHVLSRSKIGPQLLQTKKKTKKPVYLLKLMGVSSVLVLYP